MIKIKKLLDKFFSIFEFLFMYVLGKLFGISIIVRYLRNPSPLVTLKLLRAFGASIGKKTTFKRSIFFDNVFEDENSAKDFSFLEIGTNCYIGDCVYFDLSDRIFIKDNVVISGKVSLITHSDCNRSEFLAKKFLRKSNPIVIEKGSWLGFQSTVLVGGSVGEYSVLAAHALLKSVMKLKSVYSGTPARFIKNIEE